MGDDNDDNDDDGGGGGTTRGEKVGMSAIHVIQKEKKSVHDPTTAPPPIMPPRRHRFGPHTPEETALCGSVWIGSAPGVAERGVRKNVNKTLFHSDFFLFPQYCVW